MKFSTVFLLLFTVTGIQTTAQTSVVQDAKGETSLALGDVGVVAINAKDESISFSYGIYLVPKAIKDTNAPPLSIFNYIGFTGKGKGKNGLFNVIKNDEFQYDGSVGVFFFQDHSTPQQRLNLTDGLWQWYVNADFLFSQYKLYDTTLAFAKQVFDQHKNGYRLTLGYNRADRLIGSVPYRFGVAVNGGHKNNTADFKADEVATIDLVQDPATNATRIIERDKTTAYNEQKYQHTAGYLNFNLDAGPQFGNQFLLLLHSRWSVQAFRKPQWNPAVGFYVTKKGAPQEVVAGIQLQVADYFNTGASNKSRGERTILNVTAGFTF